MRDLGDSGIAALRVRGHGLDSGVPFEETVWAAAEWRDGKVTFGGGTSEARPKPSKPPGCRSRSAFRYLARPQRSTWWLPPHFGQTNRIVTGDGALGRARGRFFTRSTSTG